MTAPTLETQLVHLSPEDALTGHVNPPLHRGSTALYESMEALEKAESDPLKRNFPTYGRFGTPSTRLFEDTMARLEGGVACVSTNSGLSAITTAILALVESGDHLLISDSVYYPTRAFCDSLRKLGIETEYYDPCIGGGIERLIRTNTRLVFLESPGSLTFEIQDLPAITAVCRQKKILTLVDNTWATPLYHRPLALGADISLHSGTKFITGHSDSFLGTIISKDLEIYSTIRATALRIGQFAAPEDIHLGLRGLRTLAVRMKQHESNGLEIARWLSHRPEVASVLHPAMQTHPGNSIWIRDFSGASGVFGVHLQPDFGESRLRSFLNHLSLFRLGFSYGGFESLVIALKPSPQRLPDSWRKDAPLIRFHVGLESSHDLMSDLEVAFLKSKN